MLLCFGKKQSAGEAASVSAVYWFSPMQTGCKTSPDRSCSFLLCRGVTPQGGWGFNRAALMKLLTNGVSWLSPGLQADPSFSLTRHVLWRMVDPTPKVTSDWEHTSWSFWLHDKTQPPKTQPPNAAWAERGITAWADLFLCREHNVGGSWFLIPGTNLASPSPHHWRQ